MTRRSEKRRGKGERKVGGRKGQGLAKVGASDKVDMRI